MFKNDTVYIIGDAKTSSNNPITQKYNAFFIALVVERSTGMIIDADCSATVPLTSAFVKSVLIYKNIQDYEELCAEIQNRYFGSSQKALTVALKNALIKYNSLK
ncbi:DUF3870 domain-containing protein [Bacillus sp. JZ8]